MVDDELTSCSPSSVFVDGTLQAYTNAADPRVACEIALLPFLLEIIYIYIHIFLASAQFGLARKTMGRRICHTLFIPVDRCSVSPALPFDRADVPGQPDFFGGFTRIVLLGQVNSILLVPSS